MMSLEQLMLCRRVLTILGVIVGLWRRAVNGVYTELSGRREDVCRPLRVIMVAGVRRLYGVWIMLMWKSRIAGMFFRHGFGSVEVWVLSPELVSSLIGL